MAEEELDLALEQAPAAAPETAGTPEGGDSAPGRWAKNQTELAKHLGCERKSIQRWLKDFAADPTTGCPGNTSDGRYDIEAWQKWIEAKGKKVRSAVVAGAGFETKGTLEIEALKLKNERLEIENMVRRGEMLHVDEVCKVLTEMMGAFVTKSRGMKHTLAQSVVGLSVPEAMKRIGREVDETLSELALGDWAKKKAFWQSVYVHLQGLQQIHGLGGGLSSTSEIR